MKEIGVSYLLRKAGAVASSTTEISKEGDGIRVNTQDSVPFGWYTVYSKRLKHIW